MLSDYNRKMVVPMRITELAQLMASVNKSPLFKYMYDPRFNAIAEQHRRLLALAKPFDLMAKALLARQQQTDAMMRSIMSPRRSNPTVRAVEQPRRPDPNFGFRKRRWEEGD